MRILRLLFVVLASPVLLQAQNSSAERDVAATLDALHDAASKADSKRYFPLFTNDAIYIGTDASERWTLAEFRAFAEPYFAKGKAGRTSRDHEALSLQIFPVTVLPGSTSSSTARVMERVADRRAGAEGWSLEDQSVPTHVSDSQRPVEGNDEGNPRVRG